MEEDDDAGLLDSYDENSDSEDDMAVDMDNFAKELDISILYTTLDEVCQVVYLHNRKWWILSLRELCGSRGSTG